MNRIPVSIGTLALGAFAAAALARAQDAPIYPDMPEGRSPAVAVEGADASSEAEMRGYTERIPGVAAGIALLPIRGGRFAMGSQESESGRKPDEGPQHEVELEPFWMGACEITWDVYRPFMQKLDLAQRKEGALEPAPQDAWADAVSRPTPPYVPMDFGMGVEGCPAVCMTQFAAKQFTKWLSMKTGRFYRLPTEAEWEYACRAGTKSAYSFGDDPKALERYAWFFDDSNASYHPVGKKAPNPWGLYDMHGNVAEWTLDRFDAGFYAESAKELARAPIAWPVELYPRVVRGGSWDDDPERLRSAARRGSTKAWKVQDPQIPKSIWYLTDAPFVGFRIVRPLREPSAEERAHCWEADLPEIREVQEKQRRGGR